MLLTTKSYPAKILLFGEYTVIQDSDSLAIPFHGFSAKWSYSEVPNESTDALMKYLKFLEIEMSDIIDINDFYSELKKGLYLNSTIPTGYGAGSSGSVVAAIYDVFAIQKETSLKVLRKIFQQMESYFHGSSSGMDPLVTFLDKAVYMNHGELELFDLERENGILQHLYLLDSRIERSTAPLVEWYKKQLEENTFVTMISDELIPANESIIKAFIANNYNAFKGNFKSIASLQMTHFTEMISSTDVDKLENLDEFEIKLCGAGGGGFYLVLTEEIIDNPLLIPLGEIH